MELINNNFIKLSKFDILLEIQNSENIVKLNFFQRLLHVILEYERVQKEFVDFVYISIKDLSSLNIFNLNQIPLTRNSIFNATLFAINENNLDVAQKLKEYFSKEKIYKEEMPELFSYVLEHNIDMNEYFSGERQKLIYSDSDCKLEKGYIYLINELEKRLILE